MTCKDCIHYLVCGSSGGEIYPTVEDIQSDCQEFILADKIIKLVEENTRLRADNERLSQILCSTDIFVSCARANGKTEMQRNLIRIRVDAIIANTVREMHSEIKDRCIKGGIYPAFVARTIDQIAKEMVEGIE